MHTPPFLNDPTSKNKFPAIPVPSKKMRGVLVCMFVILVVYGNVWRKCIRNKGRRLECKDTKGNLTCRDISEVMKNILQSVYPNLRRSSWKKQEIWFAKTLRNLRWSHLSMGKVVWKTRLVSLFYFVCVLLFFFNNPPPL